MHRVKVGTVIFMFSLVITMAFIAGVYLFQSPKTNDSSGAVAKDTGVYLLDREAMDKAYLGQTNIVPDNIMYFQSLEHYYNKQMMKRIIPLAAAYSLILITSSIFLWLYLKRLQEEDMLRITSKFQMINEDDTVLTGYPVLLSAYDSIKAKFTEHMDDYKRLNSYLSHEQKNALAILRARLELDDRSEYLDRIDDISDSIDDILTLSENDDLTDMVEVDVALVCATVCDVYNIRSNLISFDFDDNELTVIMAKERWIKRAVSNLLDNAIKYGEGKPVEVTVKHEHYSVIITVRDHGCGIRENKHYEIFSHRYRVNELNKDGYGIGLSLVSHVCDLCHGFAFVDSEEGKGSTFYLSFPAV